MPASRRENHFPVFFTEPGEGNVRELGFDLATDPQCREAMHRSSGTGRLASTARVVLNRDHRGQMGLRIFLPVYRKNAPLETVEDRRKNLDGFVVGVLRLSGIVEEGLSALSPGGLHLAVLDLSAPEGQRLLVWHSARASQSDFAPDDPETFCLESPLHHTEVIEMGGRQWGIACVPAAVFIAEHITWRPWAGALVVLAITGLLAAYLVGTAVRNARTARLAAELAKANRQWEDEFAERQRAESSLRTSQMKYKTLYESSSDAIILATPQARFLSGNPAGIALFGCRDEGDFVSHTPADLSPEYQPDGTASAAKARQMAEIAMQEGSHFFEWKHKRVDGSEFPATVLLTRMELEGKAFLQATIRDITKQKQADEAVERERAKLSAMISGMEEGVVFADANNVIVEINDHLCRFLGRPREEILGKRIEDVHAGEALERILRQIERFRTEAGCPAMGVPAAVHGRTKSSSGCSPSTASGRYDGVLLNVIDVRSWSRHAIRPRWPMPPRAGSWRT